ncbi:DUF1707 SHOCT-like domain-containing protein [Leifsonia sp. A12D58]|uniref:DUF1707 SHOCT-like domain-containing protein n=1 Tax=Leifsonia sp. A12D58 TaxID=3397674 RepID=UPI0039E0AC38
MTDYTDPTRSSLRLSNAEREDAVHELAAAQLAGRLTRDEYDQRVDAARRAVTRSDLAPLFRDLPGSDAPSAVPHATYSQPTSARVTDDASGANDGPSAAWDENAPGPGRGPLGGALGATIMGLTPFISLILFFMFAGIWGWAWSWLWFLLVPIVGVIIWGPYRDSRDRR